MNDFEACSMRDLVSVIIPAYNEEQTIPACIDSLIAQTYPRECMEWIFVDGGSSDQTAEIIRSFIGRYPIRILINEARSTPISLNMGIREARGRYIVRFDAHAFFPPDYIEKCVGCLQETGADNVGGWVETKAKGYIGESIAAVLASKFGVGNSSFRTEKKSGYVDTVPFGAFKKEVFDEVGLYNEELLRSEDNDLNARILEKGGKIFLSREIHSTYYCRETIASLLKQGAQNGNALFRTLRVNPKAMRLRHYVPFVFLMSLVLLPVFGLFFPWIRWLFAAEILAYLALDLLFSFAVDRKSTAFVTIWLYPLFHVCYGLGSLLGLLGAKLY